MEGATGKRCTKCGETRPLDWFTRHKGSADRLGYYCRPCRRACTKEWIYRSEENRKKQRAWQAASKKRNRQKYLADRVARRKRYDAKYPEKRRAQRAVQRAVEAGRMDKPGNCERCSAPVPRERLEGHHRDYSKPLEVEWLCSKCHNAETAKAS